jgi:hypothetical protein
MDEYYIEAHEMRKLEELAEQNLDLALQEMTNLYFRASNVFNHEVCNAIDLWIYESKSLIFVEYLKKRIEENNSINIQFQKWIEQKCNLP